MIDKLKLQLLRRVRAQFGASRERLDDPQMALIGGAPLYELPPAKAPSKVDAANTPEIDRKLPAHLPRDSKVYRPETSTDHHDAKDQSCGCTSCGGRLRLIGQDISEQLEYVPAHFKVIRHIRPKLACVACAAIFQAAAPSRPIARGIAGPGLIAHVMVSKALRPHPAVPAERHLRLRRRTDRPLDDGGLDRQRRRTARPVGGRARPLCAGRRQGARR